MYLQYFFCHLSTGVWQNFDLGLFHWDHILFIILAAIALPLSLYLCRNISEKKLWRFFKIMAVILLVLEVVKIIIPLVQTGIFDPAEDLPLWLSSMFVFLFPVLAWGKGRVRRVAINSICAIFFFSGILTMFMPLILHYYRVFSFFGLHSLLYHWLMIFTALILFIRGHVKIEWKSIWTILIPFFIMGVIALTVNWAFGWTGDYMFLTDGRHTPFAMFNGLPHPLFVVVVILLHAGMFAVGASFFCVLQTIRDKRRAKSVVTKSEQPA